MHTSPTYNRDIFINCNWYFDVPTEEHYGYISITQSLEKMLKEKRVVDENDCAEMFELLARAASMMLEPQSINDPFKPFIQNFQTGGRSALPEDFTDSELRFFEEVLNDINEPRLQARIADLLWLCKSPRNPTHARTAITAYTQLPINADSWFRDTNNCWERAARLAIQIRDSNKLDEIKKQLFDAFNVDYPNETLMPFHLANLLDQLEVDKEYRNDIAPRLFLLGNDLRSKGDFRDASDYFELSAKKHRQCKDEQGYIECLISIAESFEAEANSRLPKSNLIANTFYENAIQAYRRIPTKQRAKYGIDDRINEVKTKITDTGKASLEEMPLLKTQSIDIKELVDASISHVTGKQKPKESLLYFAGLYPGPNFLTLTDGARETLQNSLFNNLFGSNHMSSDGRLIAKTPPTNIGANEDDPANQAVLNTRIHQHFSIEVELMVKAKILPALHQIQMEHRITKNLLEEICHLSPIVPLERIKLMSFALWLGFEYEFGHTIYLL